MSEILDQYGLPLVATPHVMSRVVGAHIDTSDIGAVDYIAGAGNMLGLTTGTPTANLTFILGVPFVSPSFDCGIDRLAFEVTAGQAGTETYIGVFDWHDADHPLDPYASLFGTPGKALHASAVISTAANGLITEACSIRLKPNRPYWMCLTLVGHATPATFRYLQTGGVLSRGDSSVATTPSVWWSSGGSATNSQLRWGDFPHISGVNMSTSRLTLPVLRYRLVA